MQYVYDWAVQVMQALPNIPVVLSTQGMHCSKHGYVKGCMPTGETLRSCPQCFDQTLQWLHTATDGCEGFHVHLDYVYGTGVFTQGRHHCFPKVTVTCDGESTVLVFSYGLMDQPSLRQFTVQVDALLRRQQNCKATPLKRKLPPPHAGPTDTALLAQSQKDLAATQIDLKNALDALATERCKTMRLRSYLFERENGETIL